MNSTRRPGALGATLCLQALLAVAAPSASARADSRDSLEPLPQAQWDRAAAAHLLRRAAFGATPQEIDKLAAMRLEDAVDYLVDYDEIPFQMPPAAVHESLRRPVERFRMRGLSEEDRRAAAQERRQLERRAFEETRLWWIERMATTPRPFEEVMTLFWHGHFTSGMREVRNAVFMQEQDEFLRRHALDSFRELLLGVSKDRAMLVYLDGARNTKKAPNENYARELMELFTLGVGAYSETDVKEAARAFTGWDYDARGFVFRGREHDFDEKRFLGKRGSFDGADVIDIILEQPACSRFLARKLLEFFVRPDPEKTLVEALASELRRRDYELRPVLKKLLASRAFFHPSARGSMIKSPAQLVVGAARTFGVSIENLPGAERALRAMGQELMQPPNVKGWDGGPAWINTATLFYRYNTLGGLVFGAADRGRGPRGAALGNDEESQAGALASAGVEAASMTSMSAAPLAPRSRMGDREQAKLDPMMLVRDNGLATAEQIVDYFCEHLLAAPLPQAKRELLIAYLLNNAKRLDLERPSAADRIRMTIHLICSTPEYQLL